MKTNDNKLNINGGCYRSDMLLKYIKGELSGLEMNRLERHLVTCGMCRDELDGLSLLDVPERIKVIEDELSGKVDEVVAERNWEVPVWRVFFKVAATLTLLIGISTIIYITTIHKTPSNMVSKMESFEIPEAESIKELDHVNEQAVIPLENQNIVHDKSTVKDLKTKEHEIAIDVASVKYVAPVVVDSLRNEISEMASLDDAKIEVADSNVLSNAEIFASGQAVSNAPVKAESVDKRSVFNRKGESIDIAFGSANGSATINYNSQKELAIRQYSSGNYTEALIILDKLNKKYSESDTIQFYISMSYFQLGINEKSVSGLKLLSQNSKSVYFYDSQWYYAQGLIKVDMVQLADSVLHSVIELNPKHKEEAIKKLKELKNSTAP